MIVKFLDSSDNSIKTMKCTSVEFVPIKATCFLINSREGRSINIDIRQLIDITENNV